MLYSNSSSELLTKILEETFNKTKYKSYWALSLYKSGIISNISGGKNKYIFDNGKVYFLSNPIPIYEKIEKKYEIYWKEYVIKDNALKRYFLEKAKLIYKEGGEIEEIYSGNNCNNIKIVLKDNDLIGYIDNIYETKFMFGILKLNNKEIGTVFELNNDKVDKIIRNLYEKYKLVEIEDENIEKGIIKLSEEIK